MAVQYNGKSPSRIWYVWQKTKSVFVTERKGDVTKSSLMTAASTACLVGTAKFGAAFMQFFPLVSVCLVGVGAWNAWFAWKGNGDWRKAQVNTQRARTAAVSFGAAALLYFIAPIATFWAPLILSATTVYAGFMAWRDTKEALATTASRDYLKAQEKKWLEKQGKPSLFSRVKHAVRGVGYLAVGTAAAAVSAVAALEYTGILSTTFIANAAISTGIVAGAAAMPFIIGITAALGVTGLSLGIWKRVAKPKNGSTPAAAPSAKANAPSKTLPAAAPAFEQAAPKPAAPQMTEQMKRNAEARAAARKAAKNRRP